MSSLLNKSLTAFLLLILAAHGPIAMGAVCAVSGMPDADKSAADADTRSDDPGKPAEGTTPEPVPARSTAKKPAYRHTCGMHAPGAASESCDHCRSHCEMIDPSGPGGEDAKAIAAAPEPTSTLTAAPCAGPVGSHDSGALTVGLLRYVVPGAPALDFGLPTELKFFMNDTHRYFAALEPLSPPPQNLRI